MSDTLASPLSKDVLAGYDCLRAGCGRYELRHSALLELRGDDRTGWLQGQVTNDVRNFGVGNSTQFCFCSPTGQIQAYCELWALPERLLIRTHKTAVHAILSRCEETILLADVEYSDMSSHYRLISIQGPEATRGLRELVDIPNLDAGVATLEGVEVICLRSNRTGLGGWDLLLPRIADEAAQRIESHFDPVPEASFEIARLEAGFPRFGIDISGKVLPPELGPAFENRTVSYNKGCYVGQEVLMRIRSRGHTNRTWVPLLSDSLLAPGCEVLNASGKPVGAVVTSAFSPQFGPIASAWMRNEAAVDGVAVTANGIRAEVASFPLLRME